MTGSLSLLERLALVVRGWVAAAAWDQDRPRRPRLRNPAARGRGRPVEGTFYRLTATRVATGVDFLSNRARGLGPRGAELADPDLHDGISAFRRLRDARRRAVRFPRLGPYIARMAITRVAGITGRKT